jgi:hypothetical protein
MPTEKQIAMGRAIVEFEGRFDDDGNLQVYRLPAGDGGGNYEIAGINEKHHPKNAKELRNMINGGKNKEAQHAAAEYIEEYTNPVANWFQSEADREANQGVEFILRDCYFNRGARGAGTILQLALKIMPIDGIVGPNTKGYFREALYEEGQNSIMLKLTQAREDYERMKFPWKTSSRDESSKFWEGLSNRWVKAHGIAKDRFV